MQYFNYFAYGSNMLKRRLVARCPSAQVINCGYVLGFSFTFKKRGEDGSGKAGLTYAPNSSTPVHGVLYRIPLSELNLLDEAEWEGNGYDRIDGISTASSVNNKIIKSSTYLATDLHNDLQPFDWYKALVVAGAKENKLPMYWINMLRSIDALNDPVPSRANRLHALEILGK